jgi:hypothetical protein
VEVGYGCCITQYFDLAVLQNEHLCCRENTVACRNVAIKNNGRYKKGDKKDYIRSNALAKKVQLKGNTMEQYPPPIAYTPKKATTDTKNKTQ